MKIERKRAAREPKIVKEATAVARAQNLHVEFAERYREYCEEDYDTAEACWAALYDWDLLDPSGRWVDSQGVVYGVHGAIKRENCADEAAVSEGTN